ncbi:MAG: hypothetical protein QOK15_1364 [Nocardioidaceae bacterium]|jgi:hypothetical protein|nr:hypothetical protein [Nocardioidaceae bacterium]
MTLTEVVLMVALLGVVALLLAGSLLVLLAVSTVRRGRRRYQAFRVRRVGRLPGHGTWNTGSASAIVTATLGSPTWWLTQTRRHRMWRAVTAAEHGVKVAQRSGAPVGDLPSLARRLRAAGVGVDAQLRVSTVNRTASRAATAAAARIEAAAADLQGAAEDAVRVTAADQTEPLMSAIQLEVAALAAGVRAASGASELPHRA